MRILLLLLIPPILLFLCALITMWLPLPEPFPPALSGGRNLISAVVTGILGIGYLLGLAVYVVFAFLRAGRVLDPLLASMGMASKNYLLFGRQYHGALEGREAEVSFMPSRALWPTQLNIYVKADIGTRVAMGRQRPLLDCRDCARMDISAAEIPGLQVYAQEEGNASRLLTDAASREAMLRLLDDQDDYGFREVYLQPERVWLRAHPREMTAARFRQWLDDVLVLAEASERALELSE